MDNKELKAQLEKLTRDDLNIIGRKLKIKKFRRKRKEELIQCILTEYTEKDIKKTLSIGFWDRYHVHIYGVCGIIALILTFLTVLPRFQDGGEPTPQINIQFDELIHELEQREKKDENRSMASRTFWLLQEKGATFSLGPCPGENCLHVELGDLKQKDDQLIQQFLLSGQVFSFFQKKIGKGFIFGTDTAFFIKGKGSGFSISVDRKIRSYLPLTKEAAIEIFTKSIDIKFTILDTKADSLKIKLEVRRGGQEYERIWNEIQQNTQAGE